MPRWSGIDLRPYILPAVGEVLCIIAGVAAFITTGKAVWLAAGVLAGVGVSLPAAVRLIRELREGRSASR